MPLPLTSPPSSALPWKWNKQREQAAMLAAEDKLSDLQICAKLDISRPTLADWKRYPEFQARMAEITEDYRKVIRSRGIAIMENRVADLADRQARMKQVITERAEKYNKPEIPGGSTGIVAVEFKGVGTGKDFKLIPEYPVDVALLREMRAHEQQAAQELGQWEKRGEVSGMKARIDENGVVTVEMFRAMLDAPTNRHGQLPSGMEEAV